MSTMIPIHILSGFLGSGKTTLLTKTIDYLTQQGKRPAVIMNELGDVNLDGLMVESSVPMTEMLSGCICCTVRGDLGVAIQDLVEAEQPDVIIIESTGVANPSEILDAVTETSLYMDVELQSIITVVDVLHLLEVFNKGKGKTLRLMQDQIRCASFIILNKVDLVQPAQLVEVEKLIRELNTVSPITATIKCEIDLTFFDEDHTYRVAQDSKTDPEHLHQENEHQGHEHHAHEHHTHEHHNHDHHDNNHEDKHHHHTHEHVMVYTYRFPHPIDSQEFEVFMKGLPKEVYRAKGVLTFTDTSSRYLFQYAYREMEFIKITPQKDVPDVLVLIGENFSKTAVQEELEKL